MPAASTSQLDKKGHVCRAPDAKHPSERWETAFVYSFINKFTTLRQKVEGFESIQDLEEALLSPTQHPVLVQILSRFILNLRPQTRNLSPDQISSTFSAILAEHMKGLERTVFWDSDCKTNIDPLQGIQGGIWGVNWDVKLRILRQLVELQLCHNSDMKDTIDRAWGVVHNKHRKREGPTAPPEADDPHSKQSLSLEPIGIDKDRVRYWVFDDSPRIYVSTNPWKTSSSFKAISNSKEEYLKVIEDLKAKGPEKSGKKQHAHLMGALEARLEVIDSEIARVAKVRRKLEQREILKAQAELRTTRTRRQARKPDYVYQQDFGSDDDGDDYKYREENDDDDDIPDEEDADEFGGRRSGIRRSQRTSAVKRSSGNEWKGERRSARLGFEQEANDDRPTKRARTEERSVSGAPSESVYSPVSSTNPLPPKQISAAAVKSSEVAVEQVSGKKKSKYWFYAVEPVPGSSTSAVSSEANGSANGLQNGGGDSSSDGPNDSLTHRNGVNGMNGNHVSSTSSLGSH